ncbi:MAG: arsenate reductase (glutaredoxin) [Gammaproteobacteria bacterium]|nr:arsenate reductase (glutaredoxin) [Gammaproteobacteria bacterium]
MTKTTQTTLYYNPSCSKCRQTLELLQEKGIEPKVIEYLKTPPSTEELQQILEQLGLEPRQLMRKHESEYLDNQLDNSSLSKAQLIAAMVKFPRLIERPIVIKEGKAAIGRPPTLILEIL